jgi:hypothetical protein
MVLQELRAFLLQRQSELESSGSSMLHTVLPDSIQSVDASGAAKMVSQIEALLTALQDPHLRQLLMITNSQR